MCEDAAELFRGSHRLWEGVDPTPEVPAPCPGATGATSVLGPVTAFSEPTGQRCPSGLEVRHLPGCWPCTCLGDERGWGSMWHTHHTRTGHGGVSAGSSLMDPVDGPGWAGRRRLGPAWRPWTRAASAPHRRPPGLAALLWLGIPQACIRVGDPPWPGLRSRGAQPQPCSPGLTACLPRAVSRSRAVAAATQGCRSG